MSALGKPLALGLFALACVLALSGYGLTHLVWRVWLIRQWRRRKQRTPRC